MTNSVQEPAAARTAHLRLWETVWRLAESSSPWIAGVLLLAALLRATVRDGWAPAAPFFYAFPLTLQSAVWAGLAIIWRRRRRLLWSALVMAGLSFVWWTLVLWRPLEVFKPLSPGKSITVLFWNIGHTAKVPDSLHSLIRKHQPDIIGLTESEALNASTRESLPATYGGYRLLRMPDGMLAMIKGKGQVLSSRELPRESKVHVIEVELTSLPGRTWRFVLCDVGPWPPLPRGQMLDVQYKEAGGGPLTIVAGDFNTPIDSVDFDQWHARFNHGIADAANYTGPPETWCFGLPLLSIDHQWGSRDLTPVEAEKGSQFLMDHQWLLVRWQLLDHPPAASAN